MSSETNTLYLKSSLVLISKCKPTPRTSAPSLPSTGNRWVWNQNLDEELRTILAEQENERKSMISITLTLKIKSQVKTATQTSLQHWWNPLNQWMVIGRRSSQPLFPFILIHFSSIRRPQGLCWVLGTQRDPEMGLGKQQVAGCGRLEPAQGAAAAKERNMPVRKKGQGQEHKSKSILKGSFFWAKSVPFAKGLKKGISNQQWSVISHTASNFNSMPNTIAVTLLLVIPLKLGPFLHCKKLFERGKEKEKIRASWEELFILTHSVLFFQMENVQKTTHTHTHPHRVTKNHYHTEIISKFRPKLLNSYQEEKNHFLTFNKFHTFFRIVSNTILLGSSTWELNLKPRKNSQQNHNNDMRKRSDGLYFLLSQTAISTITQILKHIYIYVRRTNRFKHTLPLWSSPHKAFLAH